MSIVRVEPVSLSDWPGQICSVFHMKGCNFSCPHCFNKGLIPFDDSEPREVPVIEEGSDGEFNALPGVGFEAALARVPGRVGGIKHIMLTGGEPLAHWYTSELVRILKEMNFKVAIQTNGSIPSKLGVLVYSLDYIAMDIKGTLDMYPRLLSSPRLDKDIESKIGDSILAIIESGVDHEFRTTAWPGITREIILDIAKMLHRQGAKKYYLQQYLPQGAGEGYMSASDLSAVCGEAKRMGLDASVRGLFTAS